MTFYSTGAEHSEPQGMIHLGNYSTNDSSRGEVLFDLRAKYGEEALRVGPALSQNPEMPVHIAGMAGVYVMAEAFEAVQPIQTPEA